MKAKPTNPLRRLFRQYWSELGDNVTDETRRWFLRGAGAIAICAPIAAAHATNILPTTNPFYWGKPPAIPPTVTTDKTFVTWGGSVPVNITETVDPVDPSIIRSAFAGQNSFPIGQDDCVNPQVAFALFVVQNVADDPREEISFPYTLNMDAMAVVWNGIVAQVTYSNSLTASFPSGTDFVLFDAIDTITAFGVYRLPRGSWVNVRWWGSIPAGQQMMGQTHRGFNPNTIDAVGNQNFQFTIGDPTFDSTQVYKSGQMTTPATNGGDGLIPSPLGLVGQFASPQRVTAAVGDSIPAGVGDVGGKTTDGIDHSGGNLGGGWFNRSMYQLGYAGVNICRGGQAWADIAASFSKRCLLLAYCTQVVFTLIVNDYPNWPTTTFSIIQGQYRSAVTQARAVLKGDKRTIFTTGTPRVVHNSDNQTTVAGQAPVNGASNSQLRGQYNDPTAGMPADTAYVDEVIDAAAVCQDTINTEVWKVSSWTSTLALPIYAGDVSASVVDPPTYAAAYIVAPRTPLASNILSRSVFNLVPATVFVPYWTYTQTGAFGDDYPTPPPPGTLMFDAGTLVQQKLVCDGTHPSGVLDQQIAEAAKPVIRG